MGTYQLKYRCLRDRLLQSTSLVSKKEFLQIYNFFIFKVADLQKKVQIYSLQFTSFVNIFNEHPVAYK